MGSSAERMKRINGSRPRRREARRQRLRGILFDAIRNAKAKLAGERVTIDADITLSLLKTPKAKEILEFFDIQSLGTGGLDRSVAINGRPDRACQGLVSDPVSASGPVGSLLSPW